MAASPRIKAGMAIALGGIALSLAACGSIASGAHVAAGLS